MFRDELIAKAQARMEAIKGGQLDSQDDAIEATCWFIACQEAEAFLDGVKLKDVASLIVDGDIIGGPMRTEADIESWIREAEKAAVEGDDTWGWLDEALDRHFGKGAR